MLSGGEEGVLHPDGARKFYAASKTIRGNNQDAVLLNPAAKLVAVADGLGGRDAGEVASSLALESLDNFLDVHSGFEPEVYTRLVMEFVRRMVLNLESFAADERVGNPDFACGTTFACMKELNGSDRGGQRIVGSWHLGDSKNYIVSKGTGEVKHISRDHSVYEDWAEGCALRLKQVAARWKCHLRDFVFERCEFEEIFRAAHFKGSVENFWANFLSYFGANQCELSVIEDVFRFVHADKHIVPYVLQSYSPREKIPFDEFQYYGGVLANTVRSDFVPVEVGDRCISVSDGVTSFVSDGEIIAQLSRTVSFSYAVQQIMLLARERAQAAEDRRDFAVTFGGNHSSIDRRLQVFFPGNARRAYTKNVKLFHPDDMSVAGFEVV